MSEDFYDIPIKGFELYKISKSGKIWSEKTKKVLSSKITNGYEVINILDKAVTVHRFVALTFLENPNNFKIVHHKDSNKLNNNVENLEWTTQKKNINYNQKDTSHPKKVIQLSLQGETINIFNSMLEASKHIGLSYDSISKVCIGKNKTAGGFLWKYGK
jgi:hypothetical protein